MEPEPQDAPQQKVFSYADLRKRYEDKTARIVAECQFSTDLVGGVSADEKGVRAYVSHHLQLTGEEADAAVARIIRENIGERDVTPETGELKERLSHGINIIRRDAFGPWLGNWMIKACLKCAASRLGIFVEKRGSKGDMAEMGDVYPCEASLQPNGDGGHHVERIHLLDRDADAAPITSFQEFKGRVSNAAGSSSIINAAECAPAGTRFAFEYRLWPKRLTENDIADIFASAMVIGLGSCKAFERGKFRVNKLSFSKPVAGRKLES